MLWYVRPSDTSKFQRIVDEYIDDTIYPTYLTEPFLNDVKEFCSVKNANMDNFDMYLPKEDSEEPVWKYSFILNLFILTLFESMKYVIYCLLYT